jgi:hypothetical protein
MLPEQQQTISMQSNVRRMNTRSREYTLFAPTQLLRNWCEQRPSNQGDLDSNATGVDLLLTSFLYCDCCWGAF